MGHYHRIINLTERMAIESTDVGVLDKLCEFGQSSGTAMAALWLLLGREAWAGDRGGVVPLQLARDFVDVSVDVRNLLAEAGEGSYEISGSDVTRVTPRWVVGATGVSEAD